MYSTCTCRPGQKARSESMKDRVIRWGVFMLTSIPAWAHSRCTSNDGIIIADQLLLSLHLNHAHIRQYNIAIAYSITGVGEHAVILEGFSTEQTWSHIVSWMLLFRLYLLPYYSWWKIRGNCPKEASGFNRQGTIFHSQKYGHDFDAKWDSTIWWKGAVWQNWTILHCKLT